ncbi:MAG: nitrilase-related carbon-nitrogen hydrolase [Gemmatimonadota bacterium]
MNGDVRAAAVQFEAVAGDRAHNLGRVRDLTAAAAARGARLVAFPEMCLTGYWHVRHLDRAGVETLAEAVPAGPSCQALAALAQVHGAVVGAGLIERAADGRLYNTYAVARPDGALFAHRKLHCFISPHLSCGDAFTAFDAPSLGCRLGVLTCYDNNLPENARALALEGVDVLLAPHQTGGCHSLSPRTMGPVPRDLWDSRRERPQAIEAELRGPKGRGWILKWLPARAYDNGYFIVFSNGVGLDDDEVRTGNALILDPYGEILAETWKAADDVVVADLRAALLEGCPGRRRLAARRPELYGCLAAPTGRERDPRTVRFGSAGSAAADGRE